MDDHYSSGQSTFATTQKIPVPSLDPHRYTETFAVFVAHSLEYPQMLDELARVTAEHLREGFRVLDVGAGTGLMVRQWIERTGRKPSRYTAFEPNPGHVEELTATVAGLGPDHDIRARPFTRDTVLPREFDIALFSHILYWTPDPALHLLHAAEALADGGLALAFTGGPYSLHAMFRLFEPYLERTRARGVEPQVRMLPTPIDLNGLFAPEAAPRLAEFISFCMQIEFTRLPAWLRADMIAYIRGGCIPQNGRLYWYLPTTAVTLQRQAPASGVGETRSWTKS